jgi:hypothetical protein
MLRKIPEDQGSHLLRGGIQNKYNCFPKRHSLLVSQSAVEMLYFLKLAPVTGKVNLLQLSPHSLVQTYRCVEYPAVFISRVKEILKISMFSW